MRWLPDRTGRFPQRPYFEDGEIDALCENLVKHFLGQTYGASHFPMATNDLCILLEQVADDLDLYADLSDDGHDVEGVTDFFPDLRTKIRISDLLSTQHWREHRLRTTLAHELGHVRLHRALASLRQMSLPLRGPSEASAIRCKRTNIDAPSQSDWLEWQAGYASGAILMPASEIAVLVRCSKLSTEAGQGSDETLIQRVATTFLVSTAAARVRLLQLDAMIWAPAPSP